MLLLPLLKLLLLPAVAVAVAALTLVVPGNRGAAVLEHQVLLPSLLMAVS